jgi:hypothetical protein
MPDRSAGDGSAPRQSAPTRPCRAPVHPLQSRRSPSGYRVGASTGRASNAAQQRQDHRKGPSRLTGSPTGTPAGRWTGSPTRTPLGAASRHPPAAQAPAAHQYGRPAAHPPRQHHRTRHHGDRPRAGHSRSRTPPVPLSARVALTGEGRISAWNWTPDHEKSSAAQRPASPARRSSLRSPSRVARTTPADTVGPACPRGGGRQHRGAPSAGQCSPQKAGLEGRFAHPGANYFPPKINRPPGVGRAMGCA